MKRILFLLLAGVFCSLPLLAENMPYTIDFAESQEGWAFTDGDGDGNTWAMNPSYPDGICSRSNSQGTDDWLTSPVFSFESGKSYTVIFNMAQASSSGGNPSLELRFGSKDDNGEVLATYGIYEILVTPQANCTFTASMSGDYSLSIRNATSGGADLLMVKDFYVVCNDAGIELPYTQDFRLSLGDWEVLDANGDGTTWTSSSDGVYTPLIYTLSDDWLISPELPFEANVAYQMVVDKSPLGNVGSDDKIDVYAGQGSDVSAYRQIGSLDMTADASDTVLFYFETAGDYRVALRNQSAGYGVWYIHSVTVEEQLLPEQDELTLLYMDFTRAVLASDWTIIDANEDGNLWHLGELGASGIVLARSNEDAQDDWLISPVMEMEAGQSYILAFQAAAQGNMEDEILNVFLGTDATAASMSDTLTVQRLAANQDTLCYLKITSEKAGNYRIGFQAASPARNGMLLLRSVRVRQSEGIVPLVPTEYALSSNIRTGEALLSWVNPVMDKENILIDQPVHIVISRNGSAIDTVAGQAGEAMTYVDRPVPFSGEARYGIAAYVEEGLLGEDTVLSVVLDDFQGEPNPLFIWGGTEEGRLPFTEWTIRNEDGYMTWEYQENRNNWYMTAKSSRDEWLFSPGVNLSPNRRYILEMNVQASINFPAYFEIYIGRDSTISSQRKVCDFTVEGNGSMAYATPQVGIEEAGTYYFAIRCTGNQNQIMLWDAGIYYLENESDPLNLPYFEDFSDELSLADWAMSGDISLSLVEDPDNGGYRLESGYGAAHEEYAFTPLMNFEEGYEYEVSFDYAYDGDTAGDYGFELSMSNGRSDVELIPSTTYSMQGEGSHSFRFVPVESGTYCVALRLATSETGGNAVFDNLEVGRNIYAELPYADNLDSLAEDMALMGWSGVAAVAGEASGMEMVLENQAASVWFNHRDMREQYAISFKLRNMADLAVGVTNGQDTVMIDTIAAGSAYAAFALDIPKMQEEAYAFRVLFQHEGNAEVRMDSIAVYALDRQIVTCAPTDFGVAYSSMDDLIVMSWLNPAMEADSMPLTQEVTVTVYRSGVEWASLTGSPGQRMSVEMPNDNVTENGMMLFRAVPSVKGVAGKAATAMLDRTEQVLRVERYAYDFSEDEDWQAEGWTLSDDSLYVAEGDASLSSEDFSLESGRLYQVRYAFLTDADHAASLTLTVTDGTESGTWSQSFDKAYIGLDRFGQWPEFSFALPRVEKTGNYHVVLEAGDVAESVSLKYVNIYEVKEYPAVCDIPYSNNFDEEVEGLYLVEPNWTVSIATNPWNITRMDGEVAAYSGSQALVAPSTEALARGDLVFTPLFPIQENVKYELSFRLYKPGANTSLALVYAPTPGTDTYEVIDEWADACEEWTECAIEMTAAVADTLTFGFFAYSTAAQDGMIGIDDFRIVAIDTLPADTTAIERPVEELEMHYYAGNLYLPDARGEFDIYSVDGKRVMTGEIRPVVSVEHLRRGMYIVRVRTLEGNIRVLKFVR